VAEVGETVDQIFWGRGRHAPTTLTKGGVKMSAGKKFTAEEAKRIGSGLRIDWSEVDVEEFRMGLEVELEHGTRDPETNVTNDDETLTGKIALAHLREFPDYYTRLEKLEKEAEGYWSKREKES
jgi:hypothetical protein